MAKFQLTVKEIATSFQSYKQALSIIEADAMYKFWKFLIPKLNEILLTEFDKYFEARSFASKVDNRLRRFNLMLYNALYVGRRDESIDH